MTSTTFRWIEYKLVKIRIIIKILQMIFFGNLQIFDRFKSKTIGKLLQSKDIENNSIIQHFLSNMSWNQRKVNQLWQQQQQQQQQKAAAENSSRKQWSSIVQKISLFVFCSLILHHCNFDSSVWTDGCSNGRSNVVDRVVVWNWKSFNCLENYYCNWMKAVISYCQLYFYKDYLVISFLWTTKFISSLSYTIWNLIDLWRFMRMTYNWESYMR